MSNLPTDFTDLVGCNLPLQLAPMGGGVGTIELAAAVCSAGGLGMISSFGLASLADQLAALRERGAEPYGVGFFGFDLANRAADLETAAALARVIDVFWGQPDPAVVERVHAGGALAFWQVGSAAEAVAAAEAGCDVVVAQGVEAGGHVRGTTPLLELLEQVVPKLQVPVVAAGGITTARHVRQALDAGASGVRVGTRLLATTESSAHPDYVSALLAADDKDTELTMAFHIGWEDAPHRVLRSAITAAAEAADPVAWLGEGDQRFPIGRFSAIPPTAACSGDIGAMALYAGAGVGEINEVVPVAAAIRQLFETAG
jgi:NAD(P)H-dependent flavin oxidoreductase YrpB (nitropropane dioxygenase family)